MIRGPISQTVIGVEVHRIHILPPLALLESHGSFIRREYGRGEGEPPVNGEPAITDVRGGEAGPFVLGCFTGTESQSRGLISCLMSLPGTSTTILKLSNLSNYATVAKHCVRFYSSS